MVEWGMSRCPKHWKQDAVMPEPSGWWRIDAVGTIPTGMISKREREAKPASRFEPSECEARVQIKPSSLVDGIRPPVLPWHPAQLPQLGNVTRPFSMIGRHGMRESMECCRLPAARHGSQSQPFEGGLFGSGDIC
jgi:hypothetical protein